jgi:LysR family transcriptional regulator for bpeEF and oprC
MDRLRSLQVFARVVERGSFSKASLDLKLSHGVASATVMELEKRHGTELIRRTTRRMALTEEGKRFYEQVRRILDELADLDSMMASGRNEVSGKLVVQAPSAFSRVVLAPVLGSFLERYPGIGLSLLSRDRYPDLVGEAIDALVYVGTLPDSGLVARKLGRFPIITVASPDYLARRGTPSRPEDLDSHDLVDVFSANSGLSLDWRFKVNGRTLTRPVASNVRFEHSETAIAAAIGGAGILQNIAYALTDHIAAGRLKLLLPAWMEDGPDIHLVTRKYAIVPPRLRVFASMLHDLVRERQKSCEALLARWSAEAG